MAYGEAVFDVEEEVGSRGLRGVVIYFSRDSSALLSIWRDILNEIESYIVI